MLYPLIALLPIALIFVLLVIVRWSANLVMPIAYCLTVAIALLVWQVPWLEVAAASVQGIFGAGEILYIVFAAVMLLNTLQASGAITSISHSLLAISPDRRVQLIIIAWLFGSFIEGASGFGTPAVITVPLLVAIRFPPMSAVLSALIIQSTSSTFGAVGAPLIIGINTGLSGVPAVKQYLEGLALSQAEFLGVVGRWAGIIHGVIGTFLPLLLVVLLTTGFGYPRYSFRQRLNHGLTIWRFALFAGLALTVPYTVAALTVGPEFPTLIGSLLGLAVVVTATRYGFCLPKKIWQFPNDSEEGYIAQFSPIAPQMAWLPYIILGFLLLLSRLDFLPLRGWLQSFSIRWANIFGTDISASIQPLYLPPTILLVVVLLTFYLHRIPLGNLRVILQRTLPLLSTTAIALGSAVLMARVFINSGTNLASLSSMPLTVADSIAGSAGQSWAFFAPIVGMIGAFVAGSVTVSNLMFSLFQFGVAQQIDTSPALILALHCVGASAGNIICISNVVAAEATVGLVGQEGTILRRSLVPTAYYLLFAGILGLLLARNF